MAKTKATKGDSKGLPIETADDVRKPSRLLNIKLPELDVDTAEAVAAEVLRGHYVEALKEYQKDKDKRNDEDTKNITRVLDGFEVCIQILDQSDQWLKDLHDGKLNEK